MRIALDAPCYGSFDVDVPEGADTAEVAAAVFRETRLPYKLWELRKVEGTAEEGGPVAAASQSPRYAVRLLLRDVMLPAVRVHRVWFRNDEDADFFDLSQLDDPQPGDLVENLRGWGDEFDGVHVVERVTAMSLLERKQEIQDLIDEGAAAATTRRPPLHAPGSLQLSSFPEETLNTLPPWLCVTTLTRNFRGLFRAALPQFGDAHRVFIHTSSLDPASVTRHGNTVVVAVARPRADGYQRFLLTSHVESDLSEFVALLATLAKSPQPTALAALAPVDPWKTDLYCNLSDTTSVRRGQGFSVARALDVTLLDPEQIVTNYVPKFSAWSLANLMLASVLPITD